jgi:amino acid adenylation domain-containing protein
VSQFATFVREAARAPGRALSAVPLLGQDELRRLLVDWNDTEVAYERERCLHELIEAQVDRTPNDVAAIFEGESLSYGELDARANEVAHRLGALGVGPETLVGIYVERSLAMLVGLLGILKAGGAYVPLDPEYPSERLAFMLEDAGVGVLVTQERMRDRLPAHRAHVLCVEEAAPSTDARVTHGRPRSGVGAENLAYVIYTSGSTGRPKGVMVEHGNVANFFAGMDSDMGGDERGTWLAVTSISFDISVLELFWPLTRGFRVVIQGSDDHSLAAAARNAGEGYSVAEQIVRHNVTHMQCTPSLARMLAMTPETLETLRPLRRLLVGGEALPVALAGQLVGAVSGQVRNMYGPTETTIWSTTYALDGVGGSVPIGRPIANTQLYVLDANLQPVPGGVPGELFIGGDGVVRGYLNRPELTRERFVPDQFRDAPGARLYRTGDLVRYKPCANVEFLGRLDHQVKIRGFRIELGEIETALGRHAAVREAVVTVRADEPGEDYLVAYVVANYGQAAKVNELRGYLREKLPEYMVPSAFIALDALPLTPNGKIDRKALPAPDQARRELETAYLAPQDDAEKTIAGIWQEVLRLEKVGTHDNFFDLGGNSLLMAQVNNKLRRALERDVSLVDLFRFPTIHALAKALKSEAPDQAGPEPAGRAQTRRESMARRRQIRERVTPEVKPVGGVV